MPRNKIDRVKSLLEKALEYKNRFYKERDNFFYSDKAESMRQDLNKRYSEIEDLVIEANYGERPKITLFGQIYEVFPTAFSTLNSTAAFHTLKAVPDVLSRAVGFHGGKKVRRTYDLTDYLETNVADIKKYFKNTHQFIYKKLESIEKLLSESDRDPAKILMEARSVLVYISDNLKDRGEVDKRLGERSAIKAYFRGKGMSKTTLDLVDDLYGLASSGKSKGADKKYIFPVILGLLGFLKVYLESR